MRLEVILSDRKVLEHIARNETMGIPDLIGRPEDDQAARNLFADPRKRAKYLCS